MTGEIPTQNNEPRVSGQQLLEYLSQKHRDNPMEPHLETFAQTLANRIGDDGRAPEGYVNTTELLLYDCQTGQNGFTGEPMPQDLTGMPPQIYSIYRMYAQHWGKEAFGEEAGTRIDTMFQEITGSQ